MLLGYIPLFDTVLWHNWLIKCMCIHYYVYYYGPSIKLKFRIPYYYINGLEELFTYIFLVWKFPRTFLYHVGLELLTPVVVNVAISWNIAPCSPYLILHFGGKYDLHLHNKKPRKTPECSRRVGTSDRIWLHGSISHKMATFILYHDFD
jgi:hypothetical protein